MQVKLRSIGHRWIAVWLIVGLSCLAVVSARTKTDVIRLKNGDRITGEIKRLERGKLSLSTDAMGTIDIEWDDIQSVVSGFLFEVETKEGRKFYGTLQSFDDRPSVEVQTMMGAVELRHPDVVRIGALEEQFLGRFNGSVDAGFSFTKANQDTQWNASSSVRYEWRKTAFTATASSLFSSQEGSSQINRHDVSFTFRRSFAPRWFALGMAQVGTNDELQLDLRTTGGGGVGRSLIQSNTMLMSVGGGLAVTKENYSAANDSSGMEAFFAWNFQSFLYDSPKLDLVTQVLTFPSLTDAGRVRIDFSAKIRYEIFKDFYWSVSFFDNFDSRPPESEISPASGIGLERNDYSFSTGLGWSF
ncbi:MAG: DUF481 domain-containing protein [Acidobacteriota bacterium]|nr:MAG: DUF481 domain-containing protein [Acidobacteriota bacterium]